MADDGLKERGGDLEGESEDADLGEVEMEGAFEDGVDRRQEGLHHVVEEMTEAGGGEYAQQGLRRGGCGGWGGYGGCLTHGLRVACSGRHAVIDFSYEAGW